MRIVLVLIFAARRALARGRLKRCRRELYDTRAMMDVAWLDGCSGSTMGTKAFLVLRERQSELVQECEALGAIAGVPGPYGEAM